MTLGYTYNGSALTHKVASSGINIPQRADHGEAEFGGIPIEDPTGSLTIVGHRPFIVEEDACSQPRLFTGWTTSREYGREMTRGLFVGPVPRLIDTTIVSLDALWNFRQITGADGNRPAETWSARLTWLLGSDYLAGLIQDTGYVRTITQGMDAADYRGSYPKNVCDDLVDRIAHELNYHAFWDPVALAVGVYFDHAEDAVSESTLSISNVWADRSATCIAVSTDSIAKLTREPDQTYSGVTVKYKNGSVYRHRQSTADAYIERSTTINRPYTSLKSTAITQAEWFLDQHGGELDRITATIIVPAASAGLVWAGQRMNVKFSHLPGYSAFTSMRVVACTPTPIDDLANYYDLALELVSPRPAAPGTPITCAASLAAAESETASGMYPTFPEISLTPTIGGPLVLFAFMAGADEDSPSVTNITEDLAWTTLHKADASRTTFVIASRAVATPSGAYATGAGYDYGYSPADSGWAALEVALNTASTSPVQDAYNDAGVYVGFASPPTAGNMVLMFCKAENDPNTMSPDEATAFRIHDWTELAKVHIWQERANAELALYAHCVQEGDDSICGFTPGGGFSTACSIYIAEWPMTGSLTTPDTTVDLGPAPGVPTRATTDPTVTDDTSAGYQVGDHWVNTTTGAEYVATDVTAGAAVWVPTTGGIPVTLIDAKGDLIAGSAADTAARLAVSGVNGRVLTEDSAEATGMKWAAAVGGVAGAVFPIVAVFDAGPDAITGNPEVDVYFPADGTFTGYSFVANQTGDAVLDIWKGTAAGIVAGSPPTGADTIFGGGATKPTLTADMGVADSTLTGVDTAIAAGDVYRFHLDSSSSVKRLEFLGTYTRS